MRLLYTALVILVGAPFFVELNAQLSVGDLELPYGTHTVGYRHDTLYDASRTYETEGEWTNGRSPRPVPVSMWYPAVAAPPEAVPLRVMDYLRVLRDEGEWGSLPDSLILGWFEYADTPANRKGSQSFTHAYPDVNTHPGKFPVVVYAPGYMGSSTENFAVCELLASRGYMVLAAPGRGAGSISMRGTAARNAEGQARDVEFLLAYAKTLAGVRPGQVALMDYSFGGLATAAVAMRNADVKAVVSLDGRSRYDFRTLRASTSFDLAAFRAPLLHVAQKAIPAAVLEADGIDPKLNTDFTLYDTLSSNRAYSLRFHDLSHRHFSSYGLLLGREDPRQDRPAARVVAAYGVLARCVTDFLAASFRSDLAGTFTQRLKQEDQYPAAIVSIAHKAPALTFTFNDFNQQARDRSYKDLWSLYENTQREYPAFRIPEWKLNDLGLRLGFSPASYEKGVAIYRFALRLYPDSANLWDSLGLVQQVNGAFAGARDSYKRSLALNPGNEHAQRRLRQLR